MAKSKTYRLIFCLMLLVVVFCLSACASVRSMTVTNEDGSIDELIYVTLQEEEIVSAGYNVEEMKDRISSSSLNEARQIVNNFNLKVSLDIMNSLDQDTITTLNSFLNGIEVVGDRWEDDTYVIGIRFENLNVYRYYYDITSTSTAKIETETHFFYDRIYYYGLSTFVNYSDLYERLNAYYSTNYTNLIESESKELLYTYTTDLSREHSNADFVTKMDGKYYHTWEIDGENLSEELVLYYNIANRANCILTLVGASVIVSGILLLIAFLIKKNKYSQNPKNNF